MATALEHRTGTGMLTRVTLKDIAKHAGVSPATVSLVLRNNPLAAQSTRARVRSSIDSLGYVYDRAAANLRARHTYTVGLVVCEITNPFYAELTAGMDDALDRAPAETSPAERASFTSLVARRIVAGSGHFMPREKPEAVSAAILELLAK